MGQHRLLAVLLCAEPDDGPQPRNDVALEVRVFVGAEAVPNLRQVVGLRLPDSSVRLLLYYTKQPCTRYHKILLHIRVHLIQAEQVQLTNPWVGIA